MTDRPEMKPVITYDRMTDSYSAWVNGARQGGTPMTDELTEAGGRGMSDRSEMKPQLYIAIDGGDCYDHVKAETSDLLTAVRAGVEDGTIEGFQLEPDEPFDWFVDGQLDRTIMPGKYLVIRLVERGLEDDE